MVRRATQFMREIRSGDRGSRTLEHIRFRLLTQFNIGEINHSVPMRDKLSVVFKLPLIIVRYYCNLSLPPIEPSGDVPIVALYPVRSFFLAVAGEHWCEFRPSEKEECGSYSG